jgi:hypothetical protein
MEEEPDYPAVIRSAEFANAIPSHREDSPHTRYPAFTPESPADLAITSFQLHPGGGPVLVMSFDTCMTNVDPVQKAHVLEHADTHVIFIPFLRGRHFDNAYRSFPQELTQTLECVTGLHKLTVYPATAHDKSGSAWGGDFRHGPPWIYIGECESKAVRDAVLRHRLIAKNRDFAVHTMNVDPTRQSHTLGLYRSNTLTPLRPSILRVAAALTSFGQGTIRNALVLVTQNAAETADSRVYNFVTSLDVVCIEGGEQPLYTLYGKPCSQDSAQWELVSP